MAEPVVTNELMYELLRRMQNDISGLKEGQKELRSEMSSLRNHLHVLQGDVNHLYTSLEKVHLRLERIENRLELRELAEAQSKFDHTS
jgi:predicted nuclease with TOPRIM domain